MLGRRGWQAQARRALRGRHVARDKVLVDVVLPSWAGRCGAECAKKWTDMIGQEIRPLSESHVRPAAPIRRADLGISEHAGVHRPMEAVWNATTELVSHVRLPRRYPAARRRMHGIDRSRFAQNPDRRLFGIGRIGRLSVCCRYDLVIGTFALVTRGHVRIDALYGHLPLRVGCSARYLSIVTLGIVAFACWIAVSTSAWRIMSKEPLQHAAAHAVGGAADAMVVRPRPVFASIAAALRESLVALRRGDYHSANQTAGSSRRTKRSRANLPHWASPRRQRGADRPVGPAEQQQQVARLLVSALHHAGRTARHQRAHRRRDGRARPCAQPVLFLDAALPPMGEILWNSSSEYILIAIPLFVMLGEILLRSGIAERVYNAIAQWLSWLPGGLMHANIGTCAMFAATSGSSVATAATVGLVALPQIEQRKYDERLFLGTLAAGGTLGILIPPSINFILYGLLTNTSVPRLYLAGMVPGIMLPSVHGLRSVEMPVTPSKGGLQLRRRGASGSSRSRIWSRRCSSFPGRSRIDLCGLGHADGGRLPRRARRDAPRGLGTQIEPDDDACGTGRHDAHHGNDHADHHGCAVPEFRARLHRTYRRHGQGDRRTRSWQVRHTYDRIVFYLVLGCFMETISMMILTTPFIFPIIENLGWDPIWWGIVLTILIEAALITPPVGLNLYVVQGMRDAAHHRRHLGLAAVRRCHAVADRNAHDLSRSGAGAAEDRDGLTATGSHERLENSAHQQGGAICMLELF